MVYDTLRSPPKPGSVLEAMMILVFNQRELTRVHEILLTAHRSKETQKLFEDYLKHKLPYYERAVDRSSKGAVEVLLGEVKKGPLTVRPLVSPSEALRAARKKKFKEKGAAEWKKGLSLISMDRGTRSST